MPFIACVKTPANPEEAVAALSKALGITLAEARMRLAPEPPALLARLAPEPAAALVASLRQEGLAVLAVEAAAPPTVARTVTLQHEGATFQPSTGEPIVLPWGELAAIFRGTHLVRSSTESTQKSMEASGKELRKALKTPTAMLSPAGLGLRGAKERTERSDQEVAEQVIFLYGRSGQRVTLREFALDFSCLGAAMQPTRTANIVALARMLKEKAPGAFHDERLLRLGRRPLPLFLGGDEQVAGSGTSQTRTVTRSGLDVIAEILWRAVEERLLP